ncbi:MAG: hypothetical protein R3181_00135 [Rubricoccaceae bacterium]|nr:hypothetical protein [Rubricoccaceae bacterium]
MSPSVLGLLVRCPLGSARLLYPRFVCRYHPDLQRGSARPTATAILVFSLN